MTNNRKKNHFTDPPHEAQKFHFKSSNNKTSNNGDKTMRTIKTTIALLTLISTTACDEKETQGASTTNASIETIVDSRDKKTYKTVKIGEQTWLAEDLKFAKGGGCADIANCKNGWLYDWATAMALPSKCNKIGSVEDIASCKINTPHRGICPEGYHIPTAAELGELLHYTGDNHENLIAKNGWKSSCSGEPKSGTDKYGFSALPMGMGGDYVINRWLSADETECDRGDDNPLNHTFYMEINYFNCADGDDIGDKGSYFSVRCVKDDNSKPKPIDYSFALQTHFPKGTLGESGKTRPIEMFFQKVSKNGNLYAVNGKSKTKAAEDAFNGTLQMYSSLNYDMGKISCSSGENKIAGGYKLEEKKSKTSGYFNGTFTACEKNGKLSKAKFDGYWTKHSNGEATPCNFTL
jgi:uncharacterized protein (TIGR02145 family)